MSIALINAVWGIDMPASRKLVLLAMCDWSNDYGTSCHPSIKKVAERASMSERQAQRVIHGLIEEGWLSVVGNAFGGAPGQTRQYQINVKAVHTGDISVTGDKSSRVTPDVETGDTRVVRRVTSERKTGDTDVTQTTIDPPVNRKSNRQSKRASEKGAERFDAFWAAYPVKTAKPQCLARWKSQGLDSLADAILADIAAKQAKDRRWLDGFVPNPHTYLNQERWNDPVQPAARGGPTNASKPPIAQNFSAKTYEGTPDDQLPDFLRTDAA